MPVRFTPLEEIKVPCCWALLLPVPKLNTGSAETEMPSSRKSTKWPFQIRLPNGNFSFDKEKALSKEEELSAGKFCNSMGFIAVNTCESALVLSWFTLELKVFTKGTNCARLVRTPRRRIKEIDFLIF
jgi:hypothetical protein